MNYKAAKETLYNTQLEPLVAQAVGVLLDTADRLQRALALASHMVDDYSNCPFCFFPENWAGWPECAKTICGYKGPECWQRYFRERARSEQICRVCGCTQDNACEGGCSWEEPDLCSSCAAKSAGKNRMEKYNELEV